jgi:uncharacterized protein YegP (UPF0339 family)
VPRSSKFEVYADNSVRHGWRPRPNGETVAAIEPYATRAAALKAVERVRRTAQGAEVVDLTERT